MSLRVIGAGLGRTGTFSMKAALEQLGFGPCYHMLEVLQNPALRLPHWQAATRGEPNWPELFAYDAHVSAVISALPMDRLLVYEVKQGWGPL